jgi:DNA-binding response OmpR family regulator
VENHALKRSPPRLLIIEDEPVLRNLLSEYYESRGLRVACAESLAAARKHLAEQNFDACLLDIHLPDGNGLSLLGEVPPERALAITSRPDPKRFERLGLQYVPKPFDMSTLTRALEGILSSAPA